MMNSAARHNMKLFWAALLMLALCFALAFAPLNAWAAPDEGSDQETEETVDATEQVGGTGTVEENENKNKVNEGQLPDSSFLYDIAISELAQADAFYDAQTVQVRGEVVGDAIVDEAGNGYWITLQDKDTKTSSPAVIAVLVSQEQLQSVDTFGRYGSIGTILQVRGTYHLECKSHQGFSDIHAEQVTPVTQGSQREIKVNSAILTSAIISVAFGFGLLILYLRLRERLR